MPVKAKRITGVTLELTPGDEAAKAKAEQTRASALAIVEERKKK